MPDINVGRITVAAIWAFSAGGLAFGLTHLITSLDFGTVGYVESRSGVVLQQTQSDCGLAALATLALHVGVPVDKYSDLLDRFPVASDGMSGARMMEVGASLGVHVEAWRIDFSSLAGTPLPAILHLRRQHYVVVLKRDGSSWQVADPAVGMVRVSSQHLERSFSGVALLLAPPSSRTSHPQVLDGDRVAAS